MKIQWNAKNPQQPIQILSKSQFEKDCPDIWADCLLLQQQDTPKFCEVSSYKNVLCGTFVVPKRAHPIVERFAFGFALSDSDLFFIGDQEKLKSYIKKFFDQYDFTYSTPLEFLLGFMNFMIRRDVYFLEDYNEKLEDIEISLFENKAVNMDQFIMDTRKDMNILENYYLQLNAFGQMLQVLMVQEDKSQIPTLLNLYLSRVSMLSGMVETIKNYTSQIWNLRQTQLSDKQNRISTVLTIITAIFLPLTLITGWFGMNFVNMPLINTRYGFHLTVGVCLLIILVELYYIRKKGWWK
ncbi:MAG: hypothetical protein HUJ54_12250 [Erysipelotrichaceae bacterium]|nr:hypothetical protein [Erysipelotrichaceae bacterium]